MILGEHRTRFYERIIDSLILNKPIYFPQTNIALRIMASLFDQFPLINIMMETTEIKEKDGFRNKFIKKSNPILHHNKIYIDFHEDVWEHILITQLYSRSRNVYTFFRKIFPTHHPFGVMDEFQSLGSLKRIFATSGLCLENFAQKCVLRHRENKQLYIHMNVPDLFETLRNVKINTLTPHTNSVSLKIEFKRKCLEFISPSVSSTTWMRLLAPYEEGYSFLKRVSVQ